VTRRKRPGAAAAALLPLGAMIERLPPGERREVIEELTAECEMRVTMVRVRFLRAHNPVLARALVADLKANIDKAWGTTTPGGDA
jgi:hypothetical protein